MERVQAWHFLLEEYKASDIMMAFKWFVSASNSPFAPSVAELIGYVNKSRETSELTPSAAWAMVQKALCNSIYGAEEEFDKFPDEVKRAVGSPSVLRSWGQSDIDSIGTVVASNFKKNYETIQKRHNEMARLPESVRNYLLETTANMIGVNDG